MTARIKAAPGIVPDAETASSTGAGAASTTTLPRAPRARPIRSRSTVTNRAAASCEVSGSRQAYSAPAPAGPLTAGRTAASSPAAASASSTAPSELTQNETRITALGDGSCPHRAGGASATAAAPPAAASSSDSCLARSATPEDVPSTSTPTRSARCEPPGQSSSTAEGTSAEPAADATAATAPARSEGPNSPVTHATAAGRGCSRKVASVISPSVPCEPEKSLPRS